MCHTSYVYLSYALPPRSAVRVWDSLMLEGAKILFRVALALLKLHESVLLTMDNSGAHPPPPSPPLPACTQEANRVKPASNRPIVACPHAPNRPIGAGTHDVQINIEPSSSQMVLMGRPLILPHPCIGNSEYVFP